MADSGSPRTGGATGVRGGTGAGAADPGGAPPAVGPSSAPCGAAATVRVERAGPVTTVVLSRPAARNAVDGPTARALTDAFRAFDADEEAAVAVLWGEGGTFCAGADLKAIGTDRGNRVTA